MRKELVLYDIYPKVVPVKQKSVITIKSLDYSREFVEGKSYKVVVLPLLQSMEGMEREEYYTITVEASDNKCIFEYPFAEEQEYYIRILDDRDKELVQLSVYALEEDLYKRVPYKGDLHIHSCFSDGKESPELVAAMYRKYGFDFMAVTDHHQYGPSLRAIDVFKDAPIDMKLFPGEEVHAPDNHIHIVNFGSDYSVNDVYRDDEEKYYKEVKQIMDGLEVPKGVNAFEYASCLWVYDHIKKGNGLSIFAHPHWLANVYHVRDTMTRYQFEQRPFDAFELIGGQSNHENNMQIAFYQQMREEGLGDVPIVGSSDSHGVLTGELFNEFKTVVFAEECSKEKIISGVKDKYSVAVEDYHPEEPKVHGTYRLVSYTIFLMREYFPLHDELCFEEGRLMQRYIYAPESVRPYLEAIKGRVACMQEKYFRGVIE